MRSTLGPLTPGLAIPAPLLTIEILSTPRRLFFPGVMLRRLDWSGWPRPLLLLAVNLFWNPGSKNIQPRTLPAVPAVVQRTVPSLDSVVDVEWGQVVLIRTDGPEVKITDLTALEPSNGEDPWYDFYNRVESASAVVAMTE